MLNTNFANITLKKIEL